MSKICSTCGQRYPDNFITCTCRLCGGLIESASKELLSLNPHVYKYEAQWKEWQNKYNAAPPRPLTETDWLDMCAYFNSCAICGGYIEEKLLVIPTVLGGHLYTYNVLPACEVCAKRIRQSQTTNPIKSLYTVSGADSDRVSNALKYLDAVILGVMLEDFNFSEDTIEIVCIVTEDTSVEPFNGIYAKRIFTEPKVRILKGTSEYTADKPEEFRGVTWRLLDDESNE